MRLAFFGTGYVGLVTGSCFAELGNDVICMDIDKEKIQGLNKGVIPIYEPGLSEMVLRNHKKGRLSFTTSAEQAVKGADIIFIAVGTPPKADGSADLQYVFKVAETVAKHADNDKIIATKSTVPVGTAANIKKIVKDCKHKISVVSNPEFLREGQAIYDFMHPDKIAIGCDDENALDMMYQLYKPLERPNQVIMRTNNVDAELIKYANNSFLATKISFMNEIANLCEKIGGNVKVVGKAIGLDNRIGPRFLQAGAGYGGSCFPKDVRALIATMQENDLPAKLLSNVHEVNEDQKASLVHKFKQIVPELKGKKIAIWGLSFKPKTDDIREAPSLHLIQALLDEKADVVVFDPEAMNNMRQHFPKIGYAEGPYRAIAGADALIILTEWDDFRQLDREKMKSLLKKPVIFDARNIYHSEDLSNKGWTYKGIGV